MIPHEVTGLRPTGIRAWLRRVLGQTPPQLHVHLGAFVSVIREQDLRAGDLLIIRTPHRLSGQAMAELEQRLAAELAGVNAKAIVLAEGMQAQVLHMHERDATTAILLEEVRSFRSEWRAQQTDPRSTR